MKAVTNGIWATVAGSLMSNLPRDGVGVFETLRWRNGDAEFWTEHWTRFQAGCRWFNLHPDLSDAQLHDLARRLASDNQLDNGVVRYASWRTDDGMTRWRLETALPRPHMALPELTVTVGPALPPPDDARPYKHLARSAWFDAVADARRRGFDDVLLTNGRDAVVEAGVSNVFVVRGGVLQTPPRSAGPLPGIVRQAVMHLCAATGEPVLESPVTLEHLRAADEVWLTNSLIGIRPVARVDAQVYPLKRPRLDALRAVWQQRHGWDPTR